MGWIGWQYHILPLNEKVLFFDGSITLHNVSTRAVAEINKNTQNLIILR